MITISWENILKDISDPTEGIENLLTTFKFFQAQVEEWDKQLSGQSPSDWLGSHRKGYLPKYEEIKEILGEDTDEAVDLILQGRDLFRALDYDIERMIKQINKIPEVVNKLIPILERIDRGRKQ